MRSEAKTVEAYVAEAPADRREVIKKLRALCRKELVGYQESMDYGMPVYKRNGLPEVAFASQKQYVALYVMKKDAVDAFRDKLKGASIGKGCIRFANPAKMDFDILQQMLARTAASDSTPC